MTLSEREELEWWRITNAPEVGDLRARRRFSLRAAALRFIGSYWLTWVLLTGNLAIGMLIVVLVAQRRH